MNKKRRDSWKAVTEYLGRSLRTVQRWQELRGFRCEQDFRIPNNNFSGFRVSPPKKGSDIYHMTNKWSFPFGVLASALLCTTVMAQQVSPAVRILNRVDERSLVTLKGNTRPEAVARNDHGRVSNSLPMTDLILVLSRDAAQQAAFEKFVASQYDPSSPNFHQWLTPDQVGENFGPSQTDIATITNWLTGCGFSVDSVSRDRMSIRFSGTAGTVTSTFHTEIHNLAVSGASHIANMSDPQIPAVLSSVVIGIKSLHNFFPKPLHHMGSPVTRDSASGGWKRLSSVGLAGNSGAAGAMAALKPSPVTGLSPAAKVQPEFGVTGSSGGQSYLVEDIGPWDFATIYNVAPLWNASTPIDGTGQTIAIAATSDICVGQTGAPCYGANDVSTFRTFFNLPTNNAANMPIRVSGNSSPLTVCTSTSATALCGQGDLIENSLDVEWSASVAKNAQIVLVASYPTSSTDDNLYDSESYIVNHVDTLNARIMNVSYGECELGLGTAGNVEYYNLWQTAASEGIAVFVATGDAGSSACDQGSDASGVPAPAEYGLSVSGLASTPYNTAVGGTDFNWCPLNSTDACVTEAVPYWGTTNTAANKSNALKYVPEVPWNDTCTSPLSLPSMESFFGSNTYSGSGDQSYEVTDAETGCNALGYYAQLLINAGDGVLLDLVDTVGGGGGASGCVVSTSTANTDTCTAGATSTGATQIPSGTTIPSINLTNDGWQKPSWQTGVTGIPTDGARDIPDVSFFASDGSLSSSAYLVCVSSVTACSYSSSTEPVAQEVGGTSVATPAMAGIMALINQKTGAAQGNPNAELYKLASKQTYSGCSAESVGAGNNCYFNDIDTGTNAMTCDYNAYVKTPSPNCSIAHAGDYFGIVTGFNATTGYDLATGLGSLNVANVVNAWPATVGTTAAKVTVSPGQGSINSNNTLAVTVTLASGASGGVTPTGTVTLTATGSSYSSSKTSASGTYSFTIPANSLPGSTTGLVDTIKASYAGDSVYAATSGTGTVTVTTVALLTPTVTLSPASTTLNSNTSLNVPVTVTGSSISAMGSVTLTSGSYSSGAQTLTNGAYTFTIPANTLSAGADVLNVAYSGDGNYASSPTNQKTVTVTASTFSLTPGTVSSSSVTPGTSATETVAVAAVAGYAGTVSLTCQQTSTTASGGDGATCSVTSGSPVTLSSGTTTGTVTFTIGTSAKVAALSYPKVYDRRNGLGGIGGGALLALLALLGIPARRKSWRAMLGALLLIAVLGSTAACGGRGNSGGGGGASDLGTTAGTYTFTVQATGNPTVTPAVSTTFTVIVN